MKQGALKFPQRSNDPARIDGERVKDAVRGALRTVKSTTRLSGDVSDMVRDFTRGRPASGDVALACIGAVIPKLTFESQVAFWQDLALRISASPIEVLAGSVAHNWCIETKAQAEADIAQQRAIQSGHPADEEVAERLTLTNAFCATHLAFKFRASRLSKASKPSRTLHFGGVRA